MEKFDVKNLEYYDTPKFLLQRFHGSMQNAARVLQMDYYKLSRIVNGGAHELSDHLAILRACKLIPEDYTAPRLDFLTFMALNKETINNKTRLELLKYHPLEPVRSAMKASRREDINYPHKQISMLLGPTDRPRPDLKKVARKRKY